MGGVIPFDFETNAVRVVMIADAPWFVAADVCRVLEIGNPRDAVSRLDDDERQIVNLNTVVSSDGNRQKGVRSADSIRGNPNANAVSESGLYALIFQSRKPAAKRFRKWVTAEVLPAIRRDGRYALAAPDMADLAAKRGYYACLPDAHKAKAEAKADAVRQIEEMIASGARVRAAVAEVAEATGISERTLYAARRNVWMVAGPDWEPALAPRWSGPRGMVTDCHPEVLRLFLSLRASGARVSDCYRRVVEEAQAHGWAPVPPEYTLRRAGFRLAPPKAKTEAA